MSRFFRAADDTSSSSSSSSSESSDDEAPAVAVPGRSRFLASDSDSDDVRRVSKSAKDRRFDALVETSAQIKSHSKNNDWGSLRDDYALMMKQLEKVRKTDMVSGRPPPIPDVFLRSIVTLEDFLKTTLDEKPRMSKTNATALNRVKLILPKEVASYRKEIDAMRATGKGTLYDMVSDDSDSASEDEDESSHSSSDDSDAVAARAAERRQATAAVKASAKAAAGSDSGSDSDEWPTSSDESSSDGSDADGAGAHRASKWLKKDGAETSVKARKVRKTGNEAKDSGDEGEDSDDDGFVTVDRHRGPAKTVIRPEEMTEESVETKLLEVLQLRGRKGTNRREQVDLMGQLLIAAKTSKQQIEISHHLVSAQFDAVPAAKLFMPGNLWREALATAISIVSLATDSYPAIRFADEADALSDEPLILIGDKAGQGEIFDPSGVAITPVQDAAAVAAAKVDAELLKAASVSADGQILVRGDLASTFERLDDELYKAWQNTDAYSLEYVERLKDEEGLLNLAAATQAYFEMTTEAEETKSEDAKSAKNPQPFDETRVNGLRARAARVACRRIMHMYYKSTELNKKIRSLSGAAAFDKTLAELATMVYRYGDDYAKSQTMLAHIYNNALDNRFYDARDMLLMSHLQETINGMDIPLQVMFNRAMSQLGLCAFRLGMPVQAHACLQEMCSPSFGGGGGGPARLKELLAQGLTQQRGYEKTPEQEKAEMRRQIPYHMHVNLDFIETAHLTSAMLLEVPSMALSKARGDVRRWPISKSFQYFLRSSMKQAFPGPPENTRDYVMAATRCMMKGEWRTAYELISSIRSWKCLSTKERSETLARLQDLMKVEALRTFALSYSSYFESMAVDQLAAVYELPASKVHSVLSKMIINGELRASWDQPTASMVMRRTEPSRLQALALQLAAKVTNMTDNNEKLLDASRGDRDRERGDGGGKGEDRDGKGSDWKQGGARGGRGRGRGRGGGTFRGGGGGAGRGGGNFEGNRPRFVAGTGGSGGGNGFHRN
jgi:translation initiation factor 3 subunit C